MQKLIFIGTLHAGSTPHDELKEVLEEYNPELLLVEIVQTDLEKENVEKYPDEMIFAYSWARKNNIPVFGFDSPIDELAEGKSDADNEAVIQEQEKVLKEYSWKDVNKEEVNQILDIPQAKALVDPEKVQEREAEMLENVKKVLDHKKRTVVLTGAGHLAFFERHFPEAVFPFR